MRRIDAACSEVLALGSQVVNPPRPTPVRIRAGLGRPHAGLPFDHSLERGETAELNRGAFVFSLDFELAVASIDDRALYGRWRAGIEGERAAIRGLLRLLEKYEISATWAIVGHLFREPGPLDCDVDDWVAREIPPDQLFAPEMVGEIQRCSVPQDIGSHTYRHINAAAGELSDEVVDDDLRQCCILAAERGITLRSLVFPFNRVGRLELLAKHGFTSFRGANTDWYTNIGGQARLFGKIRSALKLVDDLLAVAPPVDRPQRVKCGLWMIPHSQFFRGGGPHTRVISFGRQVRKALRGLERAVARRGVFHLWTHPVNLGVQTAGCLDGLEQIFRAADDYRRRGLLDILSMAALAERLSSAAPRELANSPC